MKVFPTLSRYPERKCQFQKQQMDSKKKKYIYYWNIICMQQNDIRIGEHTHFHFKREITRLNVVCQFAIVVILNQNEIKHHLNEAACLIHTSYIIHLFPRSSHLYIFLVKITIYTSNAL